jgi:transcription antitermination protein NusB
LKMPQQTSRSNFQKHARIRARRSAVQALYQWEMTQATITDVISEFKAVRTELKKADTEYFNDLLQGTTEKVAELRETIAPYLDRNLEQLDPVERAILLVGTYELMFHQEIPWRVIVNEAVDLAKMFGAEDSYKYINGVLDKIARKIRPVEIMNVS